MSEIPDDIRKTAWNAAGHIYDPDNRCHSYATDIIARAIMAERERCAKIAENLEDGTSSYERHVHTEYWEGRDDAGDIIASAIRGTA